MNTTTLPANVLRLQAAALDAKKNPYTRSKMMHGIHLTGTHAVATNGKLLAMRPLDIDGGLVGKTVVVPKTLNAKLGLISIDDTGLCSNDRPSSCTIMASPDDGIFPQFEQITEPMNDYPEADYRSVYIDVDMLMLLAQAAHGKAGKNGRCLMLQIPKDLSPIRVTNPKDSDFLGGIMPCVPPAK